MITVVPMAKQGIPRIVAAVLNEDAQGQGLGLAHQRLQVIAAAHGHKRPHASKHLAEQVGTVPSGIEGGDAAAA